MIAPNLVSEKRRVCSRPRGVSGRGGGCGVSLGPCHPGLLASRLPQAAQLEAARPPRLRYLLVVSTREHLRRDETVLLGVDFPDSRWEQGEDGRGRGSEMLEGNGSSSVPCQFPQLHPGPGLASLE